LLTALVADDWTVGAAAVAAVDVALLLVGATEEAVVAGAVTDVLLAVDTAAVTDTAVPWNSNFDYKTANYAPVALGVVIIAVGIWWLVSARHWFKGPIHTIEMDELGRVVGESPASPETEPPPATAPA